MSNLTATPGQLFPDKSGEKFRTVSNGGIMEAAHEMFREKSHLEKYRKHYGFARAVSFIFQALSALFALTFVQRLVLGVTPHLSEMFAQIASYAVSLVLLVGIETAKRLFFGDFVRSLFTGRGLAVGALVGNLVLLSVAVYTSVQGAKEFTERQADKSGDIKAAHSMLADSTAKDYAAQLAAARKDLRDFKRSVEWKGRVNMSDKNTASTIASMTRRIEALQGEKEKATDGLTATLSASLAKNDAATAKDSSYMFWVSLCIELAGLFCIGFCSWYLARVFIEGRIDGTITTANQATTAAQQHDPGTMEKLSLAVDRLAAQLSGTQQAARPVIGFRQQSQEGAPQPTPQPAQPAKTDTVAPARVPAFDLPTLPRQEAQPVPMGLTASDVEGIVSRYLSPSQQQNAATVEMVGFLRRYAHVVRSLEGGASVKGAATGCGVSESTVHNVKRCMKVLLAGSGATA